MECRQCSDDLTAYIDGELTESATLEMRAHLAKCPPCREQHDELVNSAAFVEHHAGVLEPVPEIWNNLRARIAELPAPNETSGISRFFAMNRWPAMILTMAATLVLAFGLWGYHRHQQSQRDLESYMSEYMQMRNLQEEQHSRQLLQAKRDAVDEGWNLDPTLENPFADIRPAVFTNPFRGGDK